MLFYKQLMDHGNFLGLSKILSRKFFDFLKLWLEEIHIIPSLKYQICKISAFTALLRDRRTLLCHHYAVRWVLCARAPNPPRQLPARSRFSHLIQFWEKLASHRLIARICLLQCIPRNLGLVPSNNSGAAFQKPKHSPLAIHPAATANRK